MLVKTERYGILSLLLSRKNTSSKCCSFRWIEVLCQYIRKPFFTNKAMSDHSLMDIFDILHFNTVRYPRLDIVHKSLTLRFCLIWHFQDVLENNGSRTGKLSVWVD